MHQLDKWLEKWQEHQMIVEEARKVPKDLGIKNPRRGQGKIYKFGIM
jgi:hypothetical protein